MISGALLETPCIDSSGGRFTGVPLPGEGKIGLYEAHHARP